MHLPLVNTAIARRRYQHALSCLLIALIILLASSALAEDNFTLQSDVSIPMSAGVGATAIAIQQGHRLRLEISSSNFPKYDRNPNTGEHPWEAVEYQTTTQTIYHDKAHPTRVILPALTSGAGGS
jgi:predicted acyl esterase